MATNKVGWGGKRAGAGRKPLGPVVMVQVSVLLPPELAAWVRALKGGTSQVVRRVLEGARRRSQQVETKGE